ncbi:hypothetical protein RJ639_008393 [Escallonia herrerae]|uniref:F-box domain-containing protein n=1 Tax=Escallonia herrerae TaxID=1293975 RepID=A0AA88VVA4_9ASTE|nr:hypothetical protein RJ639_008393 [Escallonia herrerae]
MPMKRSSLSADTKTQNPNDEEQGVPDVQVQTRGRSIEDLPRGSIINILSRLSVRRIMNCGSVSKSWRQIISTPEFAKSHLARAQKSAWPLIRTNDPKRISRTLYLVEPEYESEFDAGQCTCEIGDNKSNGHVHMKLDTKFKIPMRDRKMVLYDRLNPKPDARKRRFVFLDPRDHKFNVANSCNGLVCLCEPKQNNPSLVCNPLTGEFVSLPEAPMTGNTKTLILAGVGRCRERDEYKVIRMFCELTSEAHVHTLGTRSWRRLNGSPYSPNVCKLKLPTYLNGALHWLHVYYQGKEVIESFDFETETFHSIPSRPKGFSGVGKWEDMISMGVLDGCLFICDSSKSGCFSLWVMKEYGIAESWINVLLLIPGIDRWPCGLYQPIKYMKNGALLIFHSASYLLYFDHTKPGIKFLKLHGFQTKFEAFPHIPSFVSLKDYATEDNSPVLDVNSRCGWLALKEEVDTLFLVEENKATLDHQIPTIPHLNEYSSEAFGASAAGAGTARYRQARPERRERGNIVRSAQVLQGLEDEMKCVGVMVASYLSPNMNLNLMLGNALAKLGIMSNGHVHMKLDTKFKIPVRDRKMVLYDGPERSQTKFEAFPHIPSFVSLKDYATEDNSPVLDVNSCSLDPFTLLSRRISDFWLAVSVFMFQSDLDSQISLVNLTTCSLSYNRTYALALDHLAREELDVQANQAAPLREERLQCFEVIVQPLLRNFQGHEHRPVAVTPANEHVMVEVLGGAFNLVSAAADLQPFRRDLRRFVVVLVAAELENRR